MEVSVTQSFTCCIQPAVSYPLYTALLSDSRWIGNPINHSSTTVSVSPSCLSAHVCNHMRFNESNEQRKIGNPMIRDSSGKEVGWFVLSLVQPFLFLFDAKTTTVEQITLFKLICSKNDGVIN